jgi:hypothetical protein
VADEAAFLARRRQYNAIVREVAGEKAVDLLDLAAVFEKRDKDALFMNDGVHPNVHGRLVIADLILDRLATTDVLNPEERRRIQAERCFDSAMPNLLRSRVEFVERPILVAAGQPVPVSVRVTNIGDTIWLANTDTGVARVAMGVRVFDRKGRDVFADQTNLEWGDLTGDLAPGQTTELRWSVRPLQTAGDYVLEVDPLVAEVTWFNETGDERSTVTLRVGPPTEAVSP